MEGKQQINNNKNVENENMILGLAQVEVEEFKQVQEVEAQDYVHGYVSKHGVCLA